MRFRGLLLMLLGWGMMAVGAEAEEWSLSDHFDALVVYEGRFYREFPPSARDMRSKGGGILMRAVTAGKNGQLKPFSPGIAVGGQLRAGQVLLSGESSLVPTVVEFVVHGGTRLEMEYGVSDEAQRKGSQGTRLAVEIQAGDRKAAETILITENAWQAKTIKLSQADRVLVRLSAWRVGGSNWTGLIVRGDGRLGTRDEAREMSSNRDKIGKLEPKLVASPYRVTARPGYDILFYRDRPWLSFAVKGFPRGSQEQQRSIGVNTYYNEGLTFTQYWPEGLPGVVIPADSAIGDEIRLCQEFGVPFKCIMSMAHCSPFLPPWLVTKEKLGLEGHQLRRGGPTHTSFIKPATVRRYKQGLDGWINTFRDQPAVFVFGQEEDASLWDDYSADAVAAWRAWLRRHFRDDWNALTRYVGGVKDAARFEDVPQPKRYEADPRFGYPMRLAYLKLLWITESYGDFMADLFHYAKEKAPGIPVTQRYVNWANGVYVSRRVGYDYNYTFGHLSTEGLRNSYGIGKKPWSGIYAHMGTLPLPRGGSIGKAVSLQVRRGEMNEEEWRINAFTLLANGCCGFEYSTLTPSWGPQWQRSALMDNQFHLTPTGQAGKKVIKEVLALAPYLLHYEQFPDVAVFHDASFNTSAFSGGGWSQSKVGLYTMIRECGFHADPLTEWDMTAEKLRGRKVLVLAGSTSIAPEIQEAIRQYVRDGGTLVALFCADGQGFPGANSYAYALKPRASTAEQSFERPRAIGHLGDVLGIREGGGLAERKAIRLAGYGTIALRDYNTLVAEKHWVDKPACAATLVPAPEAKVLATFDDGSPAAIEHCFGRGRAITLAADLGIIANNLTLPGLYRWWSDLLVSLGCRRVVDTGNPFVEAGAWHDDSGRRLVILVNHDLDHAQTATLAGLKIELPPGQVTTRILGITPASSAGPCLPAEVGAMRAGG